MRPFASLATAAILAGVLSPLAVALGTSSTAACCLPSGKHQCSQHSDGLGFRTTSDQCPYFSQDAISGFQGLQVRISRCLHLKSLGILGLSLFLACIEWRRKAM